MTESAQWADSVKIRKRMLYRIHICFGPPFLSGGGLLSKGATLSSFDLLVELGLLLQLFAAYIW